MLNLKGVAWNDACESVYCRLVTAKTRSQLKASDFVLSIAGQLDVVFEATDSEQKCLIQRADLRRWKITGETLAKAAGWNGVNFASWQWPAVKEGTRLFRYPDKDSYWISHVVNPGCLLEHTDVPNPAIIMVANEQVVFIAGLPDVAAQRLMLDQVQKLCRKKAPLTKVPLVIDAKWRKWKLLPDKQNPLVQEYKNAFGEV
jgi:hypothetical protein